jgi:glycosyltransferase involved in cell wall biosynthesis
MENKKVIVGCGTKFHSDYMAYQLNKHQLLDKVVTCHPRSRYLNRVNLEKEKTIFLFPFFGFSHFIQLIVGKSNRVSKFLNYRLPILFDRMLKKRIDNAQISITWAWAGLDTISKIKESGGIAIVEECGSCNSQQNEILAEEYKNLNLYFSSPTPNFIIKRELQETNSADYILCPSKYVADSFINKGIPAKKCKIIPYGVNLNLFHYEKKAKRDFTILFVGTVGVRKGVIYLLKALEILKKNYSINCLIIGGIEEDFRHIYEQYKHLFKHINKVQHHQLISYYNDASVFVFPSLDEGMAYVQLEAMACGLPVICTPNSGGESIIEDGVDGFIIPIRDVEAIVNKVTFLYDNKSIREKMAITASIKASNYSWDNYGRHLAKFINEINGAID